MIMDISDELRAEQIRQVGRRLGLKDVQVENLLYMYRMDRPCEQAYQVIKEWSRREGRKATKKVLARALWDAHCYDAARSVR